MTKLFDFPDDNSPLMTIWTEPARLSDAADHFGRMQWADAIRPRGGSLSLATEAWLVECSGAGQKVLSECVEVDPHRRGGVPVLKGTGFTVAQVFAEIADSEGVNEVAENFDLDAELIKKLLSGFSLVLQRPRA